jgi:hypothetical protein
MSCKAEEEIDAQHRATTPTPQIAASGTRSRAWAHLRPLNLLRFDGVSNADRHLGRRPLTTS